MIEVSVVGGGSWATALVKILTENKVPTYWYLRRKEQVEYLKERGSNPDYLTSLKLDRSFIYPSTDLNAVVSKAKIIIFAVPSKALSIVCEKLPTSLFIGKVVLSAVKGIVGDNKETASCFLTKKLKLKSEQIACLAGPCHAEEIAMNKLTYLSLSGSQLELLNALIPVFTRPYMKVRINTDPIGVGYASIYKNVLGIACGIAKGLSYGDNFIAVLVSNALLEMQNILENLAKDQPCILNSTYTGDLLVTAYSSNSRNRRFGELIAQGYEVNQAIDKIGMIAEGYSSSKGLMMHAVDRRLNLPILRAVHDIVHENHAVEIEFKKLEGKLI